jgi:hypothetical protein
MAKTVSAISVVREEDGSVKDPSQGWSKFGSSTRFGDGIVCGQDNKDFYNACAVETEKHEDREDKIETDEVEVVLWRKCCRMDPGKFDK